jgi:hypothetical protein
VPAKSKKQERFMQAVANNPKFAKKVGVPTKVGKEFTKVKKYQEGGMTEEDKKMFGEKETDLPPPEGFKKSDDMKPVPKEKKDSLGKLPKEVRNKMGYMKKGGKVGMGMTKNNYKKGGKVYSKDGCAVRGKTKGKLY